MSQDVACVASGPIFAAAASHLIDNRNLDGLVEAAYAAGCVYFREKS
jgi:hypothetical protein